MGKPTTPGTVNDERTEWMCYCCHEVHPFDPSWKSIKDVQCPECEEDGGLCFVCEDGYCTYEGGYEYAGNPAIFPDQLCSVCVKTEEESNRDLKEQQEEMEAYKSEMKRIEQAKAYRERVNNRTHQNNINHTYRTIRGLSRDPSPTSMADALRMSEDCFARIRPLIEQELRLRNLDVNQYLTISYCRRCITFFERSWLEEHSKGLHYGVTKDVTGRARLVLKRHLDALPIRLRKVRESMDECLGLFPSCPAVQLEPVDPTDTIGKGELRAVWEDDYTGGGKSCEIYQRDGMTTLTLPEFCIWIARMGGMAGVPENPKYSPPEFSDLGMPPDYVPSDWVGRPKLWKKERDDGFKRWFWVREAASSRRISMDDLIALSRDNMMKCSHCYGLPPSGDSQDLISCPCKEYLFCSIECKDEAMKVHKYTCKGASECASCLKSSMYMKLQKCSQCKKVKYCGLECQRKDWKNGHKKVCVKC